MKITDVQAILISIPLKKPTSMSNKTVTAREYVVTGVRTDEGITGSAYTLGGGAVILRRAIKAGEKNYYTALKPAASFPRLWYLSSFIRVYPRSSASR